MQIAPQATTIRYSLLSQLFIAARPRQWSKNLLAFAPLIFGQQARLPQLWLRAAFAFVLFSLATSAVYLFNDVIDAERDRLHPDKALRPVASQRLSTRPTLLVALVLASLTIGLSLWLGLSLFLVIASYLFLTVVYCLGAKHVVIADVFILSAGFVLRALAGGAVTGIHISHWLVLCLSFLALSLALGKRRSEIARLSHHAVRHRPVLANYSPELLDQFITFAVTSALMTYVLYTVSAETVNRLGSHAMMLTIPFVGFGLMRFLLIVRQLNNSSQIDALILNDLPLLLNLAAYLIVVIFVLY